MPSLHPNANKSFLHLMEALDYNPNPIGICAGITRMWEQAILVGEEKKFYERMNLILTTPIRSLIEKIGTRTQLGSIMQKIKNKQSLSEEDQKMMEVRALLDGITLFHQPEKQEEVFNALFSQKDTDEIALFVQSDKLAEKKGFKKICSHLTTQATEEELTQYLTELQKTLESVEFQATSLFLDNEHHRIGLRYLGDSQWEIFDIDQLTSENPTKKMPLSALAQELRHAFNAETGSPLAFQVNIDTTADKAFKDSEPTPLNTVLAAFQTEQENKLTRETLATGSGLTVLAVQANQLQTLEKLAVFHDADLNHHSPYQNGRYPAHEAILAVRPGKPQTKRMIELILQHPNTQLGANPNELTGFSPKGSTALHLAIRVGDLDLVKSILFHPSAKDLLDCPCVQGQRMGWSPLYFAIYLDKEEIAQLLIQNGASFTPRTHSGDLVIPLAAQKGKTNLLISMADKCTDTDLKKYFFEDLNSKNKTAGQLLFEGTGAKGAAELLKTEAGKKLLSRFLAILTPQTDEKSTNALYDLLTALQDRPEGRTFLKPYLANHINEALKSKNLQDMKGLINCEAGIQALVNYFEELTPKELDLKINDLLPFIVQVTNQSTVKDSANLLAILTKKGYSKEFTKESIAGETAFSFYLHSINKGSWNTTYSWNCLATLLAATPAKTIADKDVKALRQAINQDSTSETQLLNCFKTQLQKQGLTAAEQKKYLSGVLLNSSLGKVLNRPALSHLFSADDKVTLAYKLIKKMELDLQKESEAQKQKENEAQAQKKAIEGASSKIKPL